MENLNTEGLYRMKNRNLNHIDNWQTPPHIYERLNKRFNFNFDPCPFMHDLTKWNGLKISWKERNFINPPYSLPQKELFIYKAFEESKLNKLCVMLLPVSTSTRIFHNIIVPNAKIEFIRGRIRFINEKGETPGIGQHDSMLIIFDKRTKPNLWCGNIFPW